MCIRDSNNRCLDKLILEGNSMGSAKRAITSTLRHEDRKPVGAQETMPRSRASSRSSAKLSSRAPRLSARERAASGENGGIAGLLTEQVALADLRLPITNSSIPSAHIVRAPGELPEASTDRSHGGPPTQDRIDKTVKKAASKLLGRLYRRQRERPEEVAPLDLNKQVLNKRSGTAASERPRRASAQVPDSEPPAWLTGRLSLSNRSSNIGAVTERRRRVSLAIMEGIEPEPLEEWTAAGAVWRRDQAVVRPDLAPRREQLAMVTPSWNKEFPNPVTWGVRQPRISNQSRRTPSRHSF
eukprot:TRINITY_DN33396_c0_g1_i1.p1 TRINITY_DN33396_c0_g1~~TRINITY_DN33396_c0_g1_i1.p1  ORF type:complete len:298 (+),score=34.06 TRINITY_DN33396_c0_g1_i1:154-1047(+)